MSEAARPLRKRRRWLLGGAAVALAFALASTGALRIRAARRAAELAPARFEGDIAAFEARDRAAPPPRGAIVVTGSSTFTIWNDGMAVDLAPLTVIPRGFGGSTMNDLRFFADRVVVAYRPRAVVIYEGDNDLAHGLRAAEVHDTFVALLRGLHERLPALRVYVFAVKPSPARWGLWPEARRLNELLRADCAADPRLRLVDLAPAILGPDGTPQPELFATDRLHLNRAGYQRLIGILRPLLVERELREGTGSPSPGGR